MATFQGKEIIERKEFDSSSSGKTYIICLLEDGSYSCSCPKWKFCKSPKQDCKHILEIKNQKQEVHINISGIEEKEEIKVTELNTTSKS